MQLLALCHDVYRAHVAGRLPLVRRAHLRASTIAQWQATLRANNVGLPYWATQMFEKEVADLELIRGQCDLVPLDLAEEAVRLIERDVRDAVRAVEPGMASNSHLQRVTERINSLVSASYLENG